MISDENEENEVPQSISNNLTDSLVEILPLERIVLRMALPEECKNFLVNYLPSEFCIEDSDIKQEVIDRETTIRFTVLHKNHTEVKRFLFHIEESGGLDLKEVRGREIDRLRETIDLLIINYDSLVYIYIYIIYKELPNLGYRVLMGTEWLNIFQKLKKVGFIHFSWISDVNAINAKIAKELKYPMQQFWTQHEKGLKDYLDELLDLNVEDQILSPSVNFYEKKTKIDPQEMIKSDRDKVVEIIVNRPNFEGERDRKAFIQNRLGLKAEFQSFEFNGSLDTVVWELLDKLLEIKKLGMLLQEFLNQQDLSPNDRQELVQIFQKYSLKED